jgi:hypothetical protein
VSNREALGVVVGSLALLFVFVWLGELVIHNRLGVGWLALAGLCWVFGGWLKR